MRFSTSFLFALILFYSAQASGASKASLSFNYGNLAAFGNVTVNYYPTKAITLKNSGNAAAQALWLSVSAPFALVSNSCGKTLAAGASCSFTVSFTPPKAGNFSAQFSAAYLTGAAYLTLTGTGVASSTTSSPAALSFASPSVSFASITANTQSTQSVTVKNSGGTAASAVSFSVSAPFAIASNGCGTTIAASASCALVVSFSPTAAGSFNSTLALAYSGGSASLALTGTAPAASKPASLSFLPSSYAFGTVALNSSGSKTLTLSNASTTAATALSFSSLSAPFSITSNSCGSSVAGSGSCSITVSFSPTTTASSNALLTASYSGGSVALSLSGSGVAATTASNGLVLGMAMSAFGNGSITTYTSSFGAKPHIMQMYWPLLQNTYPATQGTNFPCSTVKSVTSAASGTVLMTLLLGDNNAGGNSMNEPTNAQIANGTFDTALTQWATQIKSCGVPILLRIGHEMNGNWYGWSPGVNSNPSDGSEFRAMWVHIWTLFQNNGVGSSLVKWVFCPNVTGTSGYTPISNAYPGDQYVDILGMDGYNWGPGQGNGWQTFTEVFSETYSQLIAINATKPVIIGEVGCSPANGDSARASWITSAFTTEIPQNFPKMTAALYFDYVDDENWMIDSTAGSPLSMAAFAAIAQSSQWNNALPW